jgi:putative lipoic acid-binding regulatory protein
MKNNIFNTENSGNASNQKEIEYPVNYDLKVIFETAGAFDILKRNLELVIEDAGVPHKFIGSRHSNKGKYVSLTVNITIRDSDQLQYLYQRLKLLPGIKFAV